MQDTRIAIVGSGFSGIGMAIRLRKAGIHDFVVLERADDVGGTWRANTYPGCQCDIPSHLYSFSFAPNPGWSRFYARQPEIWEYLRKVAHDFGVTPHIRLGCEVQGADWDEAARRWRLQTSRGPLTAQVLVGATGGLSAPALPDIPGLEGFEGTAFHSAEWDHEHDLTGERVAAIGTGASAIQFIPCIQPQVAKLHVFQRTPSWVMPHPDRPTTAFERRLYRRLPPARWLLRAWLYWFHEALVLTTVIDPRLSKRLERVGLRHLRRQVSDPVLRAKLTPSYTLGCKRITMSNTFYPALQQPNVELVTEPVREVRPHSIVTADGTEREVDTIIFGTGFHVHDNPAMALMRGRDGRTLRETWDGGGPQAYLGATIPGFPNLFLLMGPNTAGGYNSIVFTIESQINYVMDCLRVMDRNGHESVEVRRDVYDSFNREVEARLAGSVWNTGGCSSWYLDGRGRNFVWWPGFMWRFWQRTRRFDPHNYVLSA
jgi:cation diffusion facilitator CzcD-associated flavoprotein CzcO